MWHIFDFWAALFTMEKALFKLILGILLTANGAFGQDSSGKTTGNVDSVHHSPIKKVTNKKDSTPITVMAICSIKKKSPITVMTHCSITLKSPCGLLPNGNYELCQIKVDSIKDIPHVTVGKPEMPNRDTGNHQEIRICTPSKQTIAPLYIIKNKNRVIEGSVINTLNPKSIESIEVLKGAGTNEDHLSHTNNGVVIITLKKDSVFLSVEELLSAYELPKRYGKLPLYINKKPFPKEEILLQRSSVTDVKIAEELENGAKEKHIEVTTTEKK